MRHEIVGAYPNNDHYEVECACGHVEQSSSLFSDGIVELADAIVAMGSHVASA